MAKILHRNIDALIQVRKKEHRKITWQEKTAQRITHFVGSFSFIFLHMTFLVAWVTLNSGPVASSFKFDRNYEILSLTLSIEAIFLSTFVLMNQNLMVKFDAKQAELSLQVNLLAEHEITHLVQLVTAMAVKMKLEHALDPALEELKQQVSPEQILTEIERRHETGDK